jgi:hypothetical protein
MPARVRPLDLPNGSASVYQPPVIVDRGIVFEAHRRRFGIELDFGGMTATWKGVDIRVVVSVGVEPGGHPARRMPGSRAASANAKRSMSPSPPPTANRPLPLTSGLRPIPAVRMPTGEGVKSTLS